MFKRRGGNYMVSRLSGDNKIVGTKQVKRAINNSEAEIVYVAKDADKKNNRRNNYNLQWKRDWSNICGYHGRTGRKM